MSAANSKLNDYNNRYEKNQAEHYSNQNAGNSRRSPNTISTTADEFRDLKKISSTFEKDNRIGVIDQAVASVVTSWADNNLKPSRKEEKKRLLTDVEGLLKSSSELLENLTGANEQLIKAIDTFSYGESDGLEGWFGEVSKKWAEQKGALVKAIAVRNDEINSRIARLEEKGKKYEEYKKAEPANGPLEFLLRPFKITEKEFLLLKNHTETKHPKNQEELKKLQEARKVLDESLLKIQEMEASNNILGSIAQKMINLHKSNQLFGAEIQKFKSALPTLKTMPASEIRKIYIESPLNMSKKISTDTIEVQKEIIKAIEKFRLGQPQAIARSTEQNEQFDLDDDIKIPGRNPEKNDEIHDQLIARKWTELLLSIHLNKKENELILMSYRLLPSLTSYSEELKRLVEAESSIRKGTRERAKHESSYDTTKKRFDEMVTEITTSGSEKSSLVDFYITCKKKLSEKGKIDVILTALENTRSPFFQPDVPLSNHKSNIERSETALINEINALWKACTDKADLLKLELEMRSWVLNETKAHANDQNLDMTKNRYPLKTGLIDANITGFYVLHGHQKHVVGTKDLVNPFTIAPEQVVGSSGTSPAGTPPTLTAEALKEETI